MKATFSLLLIFLTSCTQSNSYRIRPNAPNAGYMKGYYIYGYQHNNKEYYVVTPATNLWNLSLAGMIKRINEENQQIYRTPEDIRDTLITNDINELKFWFKSFPKNNIYDGNNHSKEPLPIGYKKIIDQEFRDILQTK